ncbi:hypothetical protein ZWY2020_034945 [Hordeum vulgare]|nr:hypothetical protein ZWY2020_034945 [Hordeum vulgare]
MQLLSASACVSLSLVRLIHQHYGGTEEARTNRAAALNIFYGLALAEALLFLAEKALWEWKVGHRRLLECVADDCNLAGDYGQVAVRRFFYDSYSRCLDGSILDGLHMGLGSYADNLITAGSHEEQSLGAGILVALAESDRFADATLRRIGVSAPTIERLIDMLSWKGSSGAMSAGRRPSSCPCSLGGSSSRSVSPAFQAPSRPSRRSFTPTSTSSTFSASPSSTSWRKTTTTATRSARPEASSKIISYSSIDHALAATTPRDMRLNAGTKSLRVVKRLAGTTGYTGKLLRRELTDIVFTGAPGSLAAARVVDTVLARSLVQVLRGTTSRPWTCPGRYTIELAMAMMRSDARYVSLFVELGMDGELRHVARTTSQLECFNVFSGSVGLSRRDTSVCSLVKSALG